MTHIVKLRIFSAAVLLLGTGALPMYGQVDLSGDWSIRAHEDGMERGAGPEIGDYLGLPLNDAGRAFAENWNQGIQEELEFQCRPRPADDMARGPSSVRVWKQMDTDSRNTVAWHLQWERGTERLIWMDGRPHPPEEALHTWGGFSTGKWEGPVLTVTTTHLKQGWVRMTGPPRSDKATIVQHWIRHGTDWMTIVIIVNDPTFLTEPMITSSDFAYTLDRKMADYQCKPEVEIERRPDLVPSFFPGTNPFLHEFSEHFNIPYETTRGGAEELYPEYQKKLKKMMAETPKPKADSAAK